MKRRAAGQTLYTLMHAARSGPILNLCTTGKGDRYTERIEWVLGERVRANPVVELSAV